MMFDPTNTIIEIVIQIIITILAGWGSGDLALKALGFFFPDILRKTPRLPKDRGEATLSLENAISIALHNLNRCVEEYDNFTSRPMRDKGNIL